MTASHPRDLAAENVSALMDGQLTGPLLDDTLNAVMKDSSLRAQWATYHVIGDVLRSPDLALQRFSPAFVSRLQDRLVQVATYPMGRHGQTLAPSSATDLLSGAVLADGRRWPSNDASFGWKLMGVCACLAAVSVFAWRVVMPVDSAGPQSAQLSRAQTESSPLAPHDPATASPAASARAHGVDLPPGPIVRDVQLEALWAAHQQVGANSALQLPSGFLRNATFDTPLSFHAPR